MRLQGRQTEFFPTKYDKFEMGRQHLVNMRGRDGASFTQEDIDSNIEYLFPLIISYLHSLNQPQSDSLTTRYRPQADSLTSHRLFLQRLQNVSTSVAADAAARKRQAPKSTKWCYTSTYYLLLRQMRLENVQQY